MKKFYNELTDVTITINEEDLIGWRYGLTYSHLYDIGFKEVRENKQESIIDNIGKVRDRFGCTIDEALAIIKFAQEIMLMVECDAEQALEIIKYEKGN